MEQYEQCKNTYKFSVGNALGFCVNSGHCFIQTSHRVQRTVLTLAHCGLSSAGHA